MDSGQLAYIAESVGRIEGRLDDLYKELKGNGQPGFITKTNDRLATLERQDHIRKWAGRVVYGIGTLLTSLLIGFKDRIWHH